MPRRLGFFLILVDRRRGICSVTDGRIGMGGVGGADGAIDVLGGSEGSVVGSSVRGIGGGGGVDSLVVSNGVV